MASFLLSCGITSSDIPDSSVTSLYIYTCKGLVRRSGYCFLTSCLFSNLLQESWSTTHEGFTSPHGIRANPSRLILWAIQPHRQPLELAPPPTGTLQETFIFPRPHLSFLLEISKTFYKLRYPLRHIKYGDLSFSSSSLPMGLLDLLMEYGYTSVL